MKNILLTFLIFGLTSLVCLTIWEVYTEVQYSGCDECVFRDYEKDKKTPLPPNMQLVYNSNKDNYAIKYSSCCGKFEHYIWHNHFFRTSYLPHSTFKDSVKAKMFALEYYEQEQEEEYNLNQYK